jgi:hypothetical protein
MLNVLREIDRRDRALSRLGWFQIALLALMLVAMPFDERTILGVTPWIKPAKFAASIAIYAWTLAWLLPYLVAPRWAKALVRWGTCVAMVVEIVCIAGQALRGTTSHFNIAAPMDEAIFSMMGMMITFGTGLDVLLLVLFFRRTVTLERAYLWGIRAGLVGAICAAGIGMLMVHHRAHSVGGPDGGPGLPVLNWSVQWGDLRAAHALALHSLQILPLAGYWISRIRAGNSPRSQVVTLAVVAIFYFTITGAVLWRALDGRPLVALKSVSATSR